MDFIWIFIIVFGVGIGLFTIICCLVVLVGVKVKTGELENFQTRNINIKGQRVQPESNRERIALDFL